MRHFCHLMEWMEDCAARETLGGRRRHVEQTENTRYNQEPILMLQKIVYCNDLKTFISSTPHIVRIEVETKLDIKEIVNVKSGEGSN